MTEPEPALEELAGDEVMRVEEPEPTPEELAEIEAAWEDEVLWIAREVDEGRMKLISWEEVRARIFGERG